MKSFFVLPFAMLASTVLAQDPSCEATYIVDTCLSTEKAKFASCSAEDWGCKCAAYDAIVTCFNNCPNDDRRGSEVGQQSIFCGYNSQFPSSTTLAATASSTSGAAAAASTSAKTTGSSTAATVSTAAQPSQTGAAADLVMNAGGILAVVAAVVVAVL